MTVFAMTKYCVCCCSLFCLFLYYSGFCAAGPQRESRAQGHRSPPMQTGVSPAQFLLVYSLQDKNNRHKMDHSAFELF